MNRRTFLILASAVAAGASMQACAPVAELLPAAPAPISRLPFAAPASSFSTLSRLTFGPRLEERQRAAQIGIHAWVEEQLDYETIEDASAQFRLRPFDAIHLRADELDSWHIPDAIHQFKAATLLRRLYSQRQLYEVMVEFWTDHFNISIRKDNVWALKIVDDREVIRKHALGNFRDLLHASAKSPAMLVYLDNQANIKDAPNENYAREVMELHTLGVDSDYTQNDVMELARCLTGWGVKTRWWQGQFVFDPDVHDAGTKTVLNTNIEPNGIHEAEIMLDMLANHPSTAQHIASKLVRRFITDDPQRDAPDVVQAAADVFLATGGDIKEVLKMVLTRGLINRTTPLPPKFKRPVHFLLSALRQTNAQTNAPAALLNAQAAMGQADYEWPTPDGPPDSAIAWRNNLLPRWKFAIALAHAEIDATSMGIDALLANAAGDLPTQLDNLSRLLLGQPYPREARNTILTQLDASNADSTAIITAGLLASPAFQWR